MDDAQKQQYEVCNSAAVDKEAVKQFVSLIRVFTALLSALEEGKCFLLCACMKVLKFKCI